VREVDLDDRISVTTPEGVGVDLVVAGIGSRFLAGLLDATIQVGLIWLISLALTEVHSRGVVLAVFIVLFFVLLFGYPVLFEVFNQGRTVGKMAAGIRVVTRTGEPIGVTPSLVRNMLRIVDGWMIITIPLFPVGFTSAFSTRHCQRLGDLAAGTVVIRERFATTSTFGPAAFTPPPPGLAWDTSALTYDEVTVIRRFLQRRTGLPAGARFHLAATLAGRLRPLVAGAGTTEPDEVFLEWVLARKDGRA